MQCLTNDADALEQELSFDAWGNRRNPDTWEVYTTAPTGLILDRGFTGHEHIDLFDLVNMDGRVYDPVIGRFLSPDPVIQDPENLQSLNRYSYCLNNPLSLVDPSGYSWLSRNWRSLVTAAVAITVSVVTLGGATALGAVMLAGATGGFAGGFVGTLLNGGDLGQAFKAGVVGGLVGGASGFLNFAAGFSEATTALGRMLERAAKHAFVDAWMSGIQGQNIFHGMISGALSSVGNGFIDKEVNGLALKVASSAVLGGTISEIGGGKFANGAVTGAYGMLFNELSHDVTRRFRNQLKRTVAYFSKARMAFDAMALVDPIGAQVAKATFFASKVKSYAEFDIKRTSFSEKAIGGLYARFEDMAFTSDDFGNYNYGVAAKAFGYSLTTAKLGAGLSQTFLQRAENGSYRNDWSNFSGFFDYKRDTKMIVEGYNRFR